jgi:hypothetical protein
MAIRLIPAKPPGGWGAWPPGSTGKGQLGRRLGVAHQWLKHGRHSLVTWLMAV